MTTKIEWTEETWNPTTGAWAPFRDNGPLPDDCSYLGIDGTVRVGDWEDETDACMGKVGKRKAGRLLEGQECNEFPEASP